MKLQYKEYKKPMEKELTAKLVFSPDFPSEYINEGEVKHRLERELASELVKYCDFYMYKRSLHTGEIYDGFYNYEPIHDPICETVYELRYPELKNALQEIKRLKDRVKVMQKVIDGFK